IVGKGLEISRAIAEDNTRPLSDLKGVGQLPPLWRGAVDVNAHVLVLQKLADSRSQVAVAAELLVPVSTHTDDHGQGLLLLPPQGARLTVIQMPLRPLRRVRHDKESRQSCKSD